jgi:hypothetical protein
MAWYRSLGRGGRAFVWLTVAVATGGFLLRVVWLWRYWL